MSRDFNPTYAVFKDVVIESFDGNAKEDITGLVTQLTFTQSINASAWTGSMRVLDSTGTLEHKNFRIRGEEKLSFSVETFDGKMSDPLELEAQIISVTNVKPTENLTGVMFDINFMSRISYETGRRRVRQSFVDLKASEIVEKVFKKYYGNGRLAEVSPSQDEVIPFETKKFRTTDLGNGIRIPFYIQPTEGVMRAVIPNLPPSDTMNFLAQRSYSQNSPSCTFRFFETFTGFWFVTDEFLIQHGVQNSQTIEEFAYNAVNSQDSQQAELQTNTFRSFSNPVRVNTPTDIFSGAYRSRVIEVDLSRRRARNIDFNFVEDGNYYTMEGNRISPRNVDGAMVHSREFAEETFTDENAKRFIVFKDYYDENGQTLRSNQHYPEILQNRAAYTHHLGQTNVQAELNASRLDLRPGKIINVKVPKFTIEQTPDSPYSDYLSGNYLIVSITHQLVDNVMATNVTLTKYGIDES